MTTALLLTCGALAGWYARKAYTAWRSRRVVGLMMRGLDPQIIRRAP